MASGRRLRRAGCVSMGAQSIGPTVWATEGVLQMRSNAVRERARRRRIPFEFGLAAGSLAMVVAALIDSAAFPPDHPGDRLAALAAGIAVLSVVGRWRSALAVAAVGYLLYDGFLANRYGQLTWDRQTGPRAIGVIAIAVALGLIVGWLRSSPYRAAPTIRPSVDTSRRSDRRGGRESRGVKRSRLRRFRNRSEAPPMSPRRSAADDRDATTNNPAINNIAIDNEKETGGG